MSPSARGRGAMLMVCLQGAVLLFLAVTGVYFLRLRCEGFSCMGVGVAWVVWGMLQLPALLLGLMARMVVRGSADVLGAGWQRAARWNLLAQAGLVAAALLAWVLHRALPG